MRAVEQWNILPCVQIEPKKTVPAQTLVQVADILRRIFPPACGNRAAVSPESYSTAPPPRQKSL